MTSKARSQKAPSLLSCPPGYWLCGPWATMEGVWSSHAWKTRPQGEATDRPLLHGPSRGLTASHSSSRAREGSPLPTTPAPAVQSVSVPRPASHTTWPRKANPPRLVQTSDCTTHEHHKSVAVPQEVSDGLFDGTFPACAHSGGSWRHVPGDLAPVMPSGPLPAPPVMRLLWSNSYLVMGNQSIMAASTTKGL